ncbi:MAG: hypothetical protein IKY91_06305 [Akkermansia sp.]|nr:hypothetical protein [Akkermansia sp.]
MLPYYPTADDTGYQYDINSWSRHLVSEYTGLNFIEVSQLDYLQFLIWRRDAFISKLNRTEAGQEYLKNAWRMEQTKPDRAKLRKKLRGEG